MSIILDSLAYDLHNSTFKVTIVDNAMQTTLTWLWCTLIGSTIISSQHTRSHQGCRNCYGNDTRVCGQ